MFSFEYDPYRAYAEGTLAGSDPVSLVVALYQGAVDAVRQARVCLESGDIWARTKAVNKTVNILGELIASLDPSKGGAIASNLARLYNYMERRIIEGHAKKEKAAFEEVERLLETLLVAWRRVAEEQGGARQLTLARRDGAEQTPSHPEPAMLPYADYFNEPGDGVPELALMC
jgi:flagellar protein FliS